MLRIFGAFAAVCALFLLLAKWCESNTELSAAGPDNVFAHLRAGDTLLLTANFSECGEWGGHRERIQIYPAGPAPQRAETTGGELPRRFAATWLLDTIGCSRPNRRFFVAGQRAGLPLADQAAIVRYIQRLRAYGKQMRRLNDGNGYRVIMPAGLPPLRFLDYEKRWRGFESLRNQLFTQRNRR